MESIKIEDDEIIKVVLIFTYLDKEYKLIEVGQTFDDGCLFLPTIYIVTENEAIELGNCWKCGIEHPSFDNIKGEISFKGYFMGQMDVCETYSINGNFVKQIKAS